MDLTLFDPRRDIVSNPVRLREQQEVVFSRVELRFQVHAMLVEAGKRPFDVVLRNAVVFRPVQ